jgi:hypothetical protein
MTDYWLRAALFKYRFENPPGTAGSLGCASLRTQYPAAAREIKDGLPEFQVGPYPFIVGLNTDGHFHATAQIMGLRDDAGGGFEAYYVAVRARTGSFGYRITRRPELRSPMIKSDNAADARRCANSFIRTRMLAALTHTNALRACGGEGVRSRIPSPGSCFPPGFYRRRSVGSYPEYSNTQLMWMLIG